MRKYSLLSALAILCICLAACANPTEVNSGSNAGTANPTFFQTDETLPASQNTDDLTTTAPTPEGSAPSPEKPDVYFDSMDSSKRAESFAIPSMSTVQSVLTIWEEEQLPCAVCMVTVRDVDYTQVTEEGREIPVVVSIDKVLEKNSFFTEKEGASVSATNFYCEWYRSEKTISIRYYDYIFPVAEVGEQYIAVLMITHDNTGDSYNMGGISVPLPKDTAQNNAYFEEQFQRLGITNLVGRFAREVLDEWFYPYVESE